MTGVEEVRFFDDTPDEVIAAVIRGLAGSTIRVLMLPATSVLTGVPR